MRARWGKAWPLMSFFAVYLIQQGMLVGLTLPLYAVCASHEAWHASADTLASIGCLTGETICREGLILQVQSVTGVWQMRCMPTAPCPHSCHAPCRWNTQHQAHKHAHCCAGIGMAGVADNQLHAFMEVNERQRAAGQKPKLLLDTGAYRA
jgi:hypothetical protein